MRSVIFHLKLNFMWGFDLQTPQPRWYGGFLRVTFCEFMLLFVAWCHASGQFCWRRHFSNERLPAAGQNSSCWACNAGLTFVLVVYERTDSEPISLECYCSVWMFSGLIFHRWPCSVKLKLFPLFRSLTSIRRHGAGNCLVRWVHGLLGDAAPGGRWSWSWSWWQPWWFSAIRTSSRTRIVHSSFLRALGCYPPSGRLVCCDDTSEGDGRVTVRVSRPEDHVGPSCTCNGCQTKLDSFAGAARCNQDQDEGQFPEMPFDAHGVVVERWSWAKPARDLPWCFLAYHGCSPHSWEG